MLLFFAAMRKNAPNILILLLFLVFFSTFLSCRGKEDARKEKTLPEPVAKASQQIDTPTLSPPPPETPLPPEETGEGGGLPPAEPKGPITLPPVSGAEAEGPAAPETGVTSPVGQAPAPLATIEEKAKAAAGETPAGGTDVRALAAPSLSPPEEVTKPDEVSQVAYEPKLVTAETNIDIILDSSGSMAAPFGATSKPKQAIVQGALCDVILEMGEQQADFPRNIAIRVFGSKSPATDNNCEDTTQLIKMGGPDLDSIKKILGEVAAKGTSPIALAINKATEDFPPGGDADRVIVLVADGSDNCKGDPCDVTAKLELGPTKTTVHVVAFDISPEDQEALSCIAKNGNGQLFLARNENELRSALSEAINSTVPYNLKLSARAGATPIPFNVTIFKAGTQTIVKSDKSHGTKLIRLEPGTYDMLIEYAASPEARKASKMLKGVEILATTKVQQTVEFDLGQVALSAINNEGRLVPAEFMISKAGTEQAVAEVESGADVATFFLSPGVYDITAALAEGGIADFTITEKDVEVKVGESVERPFKFQKGTLAIKGMTTQKTQIPFLFQSYRAGRPDMLVASGAFPADGGSVELAPGTYDLLVIGEDPKMVASPRTKISGTEIKAAQTTELTAIFEMGTLTLSAVDGKGNKLPAEFLIREHDTNLDMTRITSEGGSPVNIPLPPGSYDVVAYSTKSALEPKPSVPVSGIEVVADKPVAKEIQFVLGTLRLRGSNAKEQPIRTKFSVYRAGTDELVSAAPPADDWTVFDLAPGNYDALAINLASQDEPKPMIWLRDVVVEDGKSVAHEAIFTAGKIKIIGRGPNNQIIKCHFKIYKYGSDRELINGETGNDWEIFEIEPGHYYLEAGYHDEDKSVMLKKWVNVAIGENEVVEQVLRF